MYDVFISYRRDGGFEMARLLYEHLKSAGLNPFFDLEELRSGQFNVKLYSAIDDSANFLLVLPPQSLDRCRNDDDWLRLEIQYAIEKNKNIVPLLMNGFQWPENLPSKMERLPYYNAVTMSREYFDASISRLFTMLSGIKFENGRLIGNSGQEQRIQNNYFCYEDKKERRRLKIQQDLMRDFDFSVYGKAKELFDTLKILDAGSNNGDFIMDRLGNSGKVEKLIGLEFDEKSVQIANEKYGAQNKVAFFKIDLESEDFTDELETIVEKNDVGKFNIINISMVLLHLKSPYRLLKNLRRFLSDDGIIIIKDIDDGLNLAYPDEKGEFSRVVEICKKNETSGFRESGRQIYTMLNRAGYKKAKLEKAGLTSTGMDYEQRSALFDTYFSFILEDLKIMKERYPDDKRIASDYDWYRKAYEDLEEKFQDDAFFFSLGFMIFTAQKK